VSFFHIVQIGNAVINDDTDSSGLYDFLASHAIISDKAAYLNKACDSSSKIAKSECDAAEEEAENDIGYIDLYNIYAPLCKSSKLTPRPKRYSVSFNFQSFFFLFINLKTTEFLV